MGSAIGGWELVEEWAVRMGRRDKKVVSVVSRIYLGVRVDHLGLWFASFDPFADEWLDSS